jgi:hypothetical protein
MKLDRVLMQGGLARSRAEAQRYIKGGAVSVGGCAQDCEFFDTGKCSCKGWDKILDPNEDITAGTAVKIGKGNWRLEPRTDGRTGWYQLPGITRVPEEPPVVTEIYQEKT